METNTIPWQQQETMRLLKGAPGTMYQESNDADKQIFRDWLRGLLNAQAVTVDFIKADGSLRTMRCTLNWDTIPEKERVKPVTESAAKPRKTSDPEVFKVYDLEADAWRSFRIDRIKKISAEIVFSNK